MAAPSSSDLSRLVERQMRNWEFAKSQQVDAVVPNEQVVHDFITISRQAGCGGGEIAALLGERMAWPVFDRNILQVMSEDDTARKNLYESMDENDMNWVNQFALSLFSTERLRDDYFRKLSKAMLAIVRQSPAILLGRGGHLILPREQGLRVRIIAPIEKRVERYISKYSVDAKRAEAVLRETDLKRDQFVKSHFATERDEPLRYDLILNMEHITIGGAVATIVSAARARFT